MTDFFDGELVDLELPQEPLEDAAAKLGLWVKLSAVAEAKSEELRGMVKAACRALNQKLGENHLAVSDDEITVDLDGLRLLTFSIVRGAGEGTASPRLLATCSVIELAGEVRIRHLALVHDGKDLDSAFWKVETTKGPRPLREIHIIQLIERAIARALKDAYAC